MNSGKNVQFFDGIRTIINRHFQFWWFRFVCTCTACTFSSILWRNRSFLMELKSALWNGSCSTACIVLCFAVLFFVHISMIIISLFSHFAYGLWVIPSTWRYRLLRFICSRRVRFPLWRKCAERVANEWQSRIWNCDTNLGLPNYDIRCWIRFTCVFFMQNSFQTFQNIHIELIVILNDLKSWKEDRKTTMTRIERKCS